MAEALAEVQLYNVHGCQLGMLPSKPDSIRDLFIGLCIADPAVERNVDRASRG